MQDDLGQKWISPSGVVTYLGAKYYVTGYAGSNHPAVLSRYAKIGDRLLTTWNIGSSKDDEVSAWKLRIARGEVSKVDVYLNGVLVESYGAP